MGWGNLISLIVFLLAVIAVPVGLVIESAPLAVMGFLIGGAVVGVFGLGVEAKWYRDTSDGRFDRTDQ